MFKHKNVLISLAVAALLAACGGGSDSTPAATTAATTTATTTPAATTPAATTPAATTPPVTTPVVTVDNTMMSGDLQLASSELLVNGQQLPYSAFVDQGATSNGLFGFQTLSTFGLRVKPENFKVSPTDETKTVRLGFELLDKSATPGSKETLQIIIDKVTVSVSATTGELSVSVPADAKMYAYAKNVAGTANATVTAVPPGLVSLTAIPGDPSSKSLTLDVAGAITAAKTASAANAAVFNAVNDYTDRLTLNMTISNIALKSAATPPVALAAGKDIAVTGSGQPSILNGDAAAKAAAASISGTVCGGCNAPTTP
jgi:subtilase-type serine protease